MSHRWVLHEMRDTLEETPEEKKIFKFYLMLKTASFFHSFLEVQ